MGPQPLYPPAVVVYFETIIQIFFFVLLRILVEKMLIMQSYQVRWERLN